jgi:hypothetical protein
MTMANAKQMLAKLTKNRTPSVKAAKPEKVEIELTGSVGEAFDNWIAASIAAEICQSRKTIDGSQVDEHLFNKFVEQLYQQKFQPENPKVSHGDNGANWQVQARFKVQVKTSEELAEKLGEAIDNGEQLIAQEVDCTAETTLRPFNELAIGHYVGKDFVEATEKEQSVAKKLMQFIQKLSDDEQDLILRHEDKMKVKPGFFDRVASYCTSIDDLKVVLSLIQPVHFLSHAKFAQEATPVERHELLIESVKNILGTVEEE